MLTIDTIKTVVSNLGQKYGIKNAYLFGSYAKNTANESSDVDLVIEKGDITTYKDYFHFCEELESELGTSVDVLTEKSIKPKFYELIKNDRILLYGA